MKSTDTNGIEYNYFTAQFLGWNGSRSRVIVEVSGCWDTEAEAQKALDEKCAEERQDWYDKAGQDEADADDTHGGWLSDYQRFSTHFSVTPKINGRLDHEKTMTLNPGELPEFEVA